MKSFWFLRILIVLKVDPILQPLVSPSPPIFIDESVFLLPGSRVPIGPQTLKTSLRLGMP